MTEWLHTGLRLTGQAYAKDMFDLNVTVLPRKAFVLQLPLKYSQWLSMPNFVKYPSGKPYRSLDCYVFNAYGIL